MRSLLDYLKRNAELIGTSTAIELESEQINWGHFYSLVSLWSQILSARGISFNDRIGVYLPNPIEHAAATYAIMGSGAVIVPINSNLRGQEFVESLQRIGVKQIIKSRDSHFPLHTFGKYDSDISFIQVGIDLPKEVVASPSPSAIPLQLHLPSFLLYSSGTSGEPKLIMHTVQTATRSAELQAAHIGLTRQDVLFHALPLYGSFSIALMNAAVIAGTTLIIRREFDVSRLIQDKSLKKSTLFAYVPTMMISLLHWPIEDSTEVFPEGSAVISSGAVLDPTIASNFSKRFGVKVLNLYGSTEALGGIAGTTRKGEFPAGSIGVPYPETELQIVDEHGCEVPRNTIGLLMAKGPHILATAFLFTGDLALQDTNGMYFLIGRATDTIVSGGVNIHPAEVESIILEHPDIQQCVVFPVKDDLFGEVPYAAVTLKQGVSNTMNTSREIRQYCQQRLSKHSFPKKILITDNVPVTIDGKVSRRSFARLLL